MPFPTRSHLYIHLATAEKSGARIGRFRILCAIFGGLAGAYSAMTLIVCLIPSEVGQAMIIAFLFTPLLWACAALWISLAATRLQALLRSVVPTTLFTLAVLFRA